jgi:ATP-dependent RNA helicase RhlE
MYNRSFGRPLNRGTSRFGSRPTYNRRPSGRFGNKKNLGQTIDISKFINKAVITEEVEHFVPEHNFVDFHIDERLKHNIVSKGYSIPTPIQDKSIPHILRGSDIVGIANTGTGKTAAFLIPLIDKVLHVPKENVLIVAPTRELAIQIDQELKAFTKGLKLYSVCAVGGAPIGAQIRELKFHNNFIIGTPGRLKDLIDRKFINLSTFTTLVLDEADRMLDMGFINDIRFVVKLMPKVRHTLFFSATITKEIEGLIS